MTIASFPYLFRVKKHELVNTEVTLSPPKIFNVFCENEKCDEKNHYDERREYVVKKRSLEHLFLVF